MSDFPSFRYDQARVECSCGRKLAAEIDKHDNMIRLVMPADPCPTDQECQDRLVRDLLLAFGYDPSTPRGPTTRVR